MLRASWSVTPRFGMSVPGTMPGGLLTQLMRLSGVLAKWPAIVPLAPKVRMRGDDQSAGLRLQPRDIVKPTHRLGRGRREVEEQDVAPLDRALGTGDERNAALTGIAGNPWVGELGVVERDGERVEAQLGRPGHQIQRAVGNPVDRIFASMEMKVYFQHVRYPRTGRPTPVPGDPPRRTVGRNGQGVH